MKLNKSIITIVVLTLILIGGGVLAGIVYTKQKAKIEELSNQQAATDTIITTLHQQNQGYYAQIRKDSAALADNSKEISRLLFQRSLLNSELLKAKKALRDFTAGESIDYFVKYSGATGSRMYVVNSDTSLIVADNGIRKTDSIFAEHAFYKQLAPRLDSIITVQSSSLNTCTHSINQYKLLIVSKDQEIAHQQEATNAVKSKMQSIIDKIKLQRNVAGGGAVVFLTLTVLLII